MEVAAMTSEDFEALAAPEAFRPFTIVTKSGWSAEVPRPEFLDVPPQPASYVVVYTTGTARIPRLVYLDAIDHIEYRNRESE
jgi:hypothetical protein